MLAVVVGCTPWTKGEDDGPAAPLAIQGYCPVTYFQEDKAAKGNPLIQTVYAGDTYYFAKEDYKKKFESEPDKYIPQFGSWCTMALGGPYANKLESDPQVYLIKNDRLYLFSSERAKKAYLAEPEGVLEAARERFGHPWLSGYCPVTLHDEKKAVEGDAKFRVAFRRLVFHCSSAEAKAKFAKSPQTYLPEYAGFDPVHLGAEEFILGTGKYIKVRDGKVYMFINEENMKKFEENAEDVIERADAQRIRLIAFK
jgi:YHS domain-containing protein